MDNLAPGAQPDLSICIVSHSTRELLEDCLASLFGLQTRVRFEVWVVDNGSQDGTLEMLAARYPQVRLIRLASNEGYTRPMNQALNRAGGRYLMQLNPDTVLHPGLLDTLLEYMETHPAVGIVTPKVLNRDGSLQRQCRRSAARPWDVLTYFSGLSRLFPRSPLFGRYLMTYMDADTTHEAEAVSGSCMLIRRAVVDQIGYLDERFYAYQEDADFCFRARRAGWKIVYLPTASLVHFGGQGGSLQAPYAAILAWHRSYYRYYRKNLAQDYFFLLNGLMYLAMGAKLGLSLLVNLFRKEKIVSTPKP